MNKIILVTILSFGLCFDLAYGSLCPGGQVQCRSSQTCCRLSQGGYACCPYQLATCCSDGLHCCPHQTTCDTAHGRCISSHPLLTKLMESTDWADQEDADDVEGDDELQSLTPLDGKKKCPDGIQSCPDTYTCCSLATGGYGCCPLDGGVCCADQVHCCPRGSTCNQGSCDAIAIEY